MPTLKPTLLATAFVLAAAPALAETAQVPVKEAPAPATESVVAEAAPLTAAEMDGLSRAGMQAMQLVAMAVGEVKNGEDVTAAEKLRHAAAILSAISQVEPKVRATEGIGHIVGTDGPFMLPIMSESGLVFDKDPDAVVKAEVEKAGKLMEAGKSDEASAVLKAAGAKVSVSWLTLPVANTVATIEEAARELDDSKTDAALARLAAIRDSVQVKTETIEFES